MTPALQEKADDSELVQRADRGGRIEGSARPAICDGNGADFFIRTGTGAARTVKKPNWKNFGAGRPSTPE